MRYTTFISIVCSLALYGEELARSDSVPKEHTETADDTYLEGYIQALVNAHYYEFNILVDVKDQHVYLYNLPENRLTRNSIIAFVKDVPGVKDVHRGEGTPPKGASDREKKEVNKISGVWLPQSTLLFQPILGDPREPMYSVQARFGDTVLGQKSVAVSYGDTFPIYRWRNVGGIGAAMQLEITAGVWSVFHMFVHHGNEWSELVNTSFLIGFPVTLAFDNWAFRFRIYHQSCHLGDEFMKYHPNVKRVNPSIEAIDIFANYQVTDGLRFYFGPGVVINSDESFPIKPMYFEFGSELRALGRRSFYHQLYGTGFLALNVRLWQEMNYRMDFTGMLGYEWSKLQGIGRKFRFFIGYHNGYSEGQFFKETSDYFMFGLSYGF